MNVNQLKRTLACTLLLVAAAGRTALASEAAPTSEAAAKQHFDALAERLHQAKAEYETLFLQAVDEARTSDDGTARPDTKAQVLSARDRHDLILEQLMLMSARYGWPIPDPPAPSEQSGGAGGDASNADADELDEFAAVDVLLQRHFAQEAARIAATVALPDTPIRPLPKR